MTDLGSRFITSGGEPIEPDGRLVHMSHVMGPLPAGVLDLRTRAQGDVEQGVGVSADGGWLTVDAGPGGPTFDDLVVEATFEVD